VIARVVDVARSRGETLRPHSRDIDLYFLELSADTVGVVEQELRHAMARASGSR